MTAQPNLPAPTPRHDGWTAERQQGFLKALATCGCVTHAARRPHEPANPSASCAGACASRDPSRARA